MHRIFANRQREILADGAVIGIGGVGCAHHFAVLGDGVFAFENLHDDGLGRHEFHQFAVKRAVLVHLIEPAGLCGRQVDALLRDDAQAGLFEAGVDLAGQVAAGRVGFDDRQRAFGGHEIPFRLMRQAPCPPTDTGVALP
jgi:hypothetical protein